MYVCVPVLFPFNIITFIDIAISISKYILRSLNTKFLDGCSIREFYVNSYYNGLWYHDSCLHLSVIFLYRLVRFNKRFRAIFNTLAVLLPQIISTIVLLLLIYYFFAIIGMEAFSEAPLIHCCKLVI